MIRAAKAVQLTVLLLCCEASAWGQTSTYDRAVSAFKAREYAQAAELFARAETEAPGATDALLYQGKALANLGYFPEAEKPLRLMVLKHPESVDGLAFLGYVLNRENKAAESLKYYNLAAQLASPAADDLKIVALDYVLLNDVPSATGWLEKAVQLDPRNGECWYFLGRAYFEAGRFRQAKPAFTKALELEPHYAKAEDYLGLILQSENDKAAAEKAFKDAIAWAQADGHPSEHPYLHLADLYDSENRDVDALGPLNEAKRIAPASGLVSDRLGRVYLHLGQVQAARHELEEAIQHDPNNASAHYLLGRAYEQLGLAERAKDEFRRAEELFGSGQGPTN